MALDGKPPEPVLERRDRVPSSPVQADGDMLAVAEYLSDEAGERGARTYLDECPYPARIHSLDYVNEPDRCRDLGGEAAADFIWIGRVNACITAGVGVERWSAHVLR